MHRAERRRKPHTRDKRDDAASSLYDDALSGFRGAAVAAAAAADAMLCYRAAAQVSHNRVPFLLSLRPGYIITHRGFFVFFCFSFFTPAPSG